ncbi:hypothetical protein ILUMI_01964 [Ignelater luminosus]|uniref:Uncharacterized protein n=1 Tax=Ignelater luminosus TaxID=2038154 RepID=A0A8K0GLR8_IGNLU|nr:hypothetical protein ILUMI_01964 [Ignelater luminosus]
MKAAPAERGELVTFIGIVNAAGQSIPPKNQTWLDRDFVINNASQVEPLPSVSKEPGNVTIGRPKKLFSESSNKTKTRRVASIIAQRSPEELSFATETCLRSQGKQDAATMMAEIVSSPTRATKVKQAYKRKRNDLPQRINNEQDVVSLLEDPSFLICTVDSSSDENEDSKISKKSRHFKVYTDSPENDRLEEMEREKENRKNKYPKPNLFNKNVRKQPLEKVKFNQVYSDFSSSVSNVSLRDNSDEDLSEEFEDIKKLNKEELSKGDFVLIRLKVKNAMVHFVGQILSILDEDTTKIKFLRRKGLSNLSFLS